MPPVPVLAGAWSRPSPRVLVLRRLVWLAVLGLVGAAGAGIAAASSGPAGAAAALVLAVAVAALSWVLLERQWQAWGYAEREDDLLVRSGLVVRRVSVVPYGRMQFVDVTSGPLERRFGLATVRLHTAAAASDAGIAGLERAEADRLRDRLAALGEARAAGL